MNKRLIAFGLCAGLALGTCGCSANYENMNDDKLSVVTTIFPPYDFAREIGGDRIELKMLVTPGGESHSYEPVPQDIIAVRNCDIFICAGGESDVWSNNILDSIDTENITVIKMMDCVETVEEEHKEGMEGHHEEDGDEIEYDEHVWTSLRNAAEISKTIGDAMNEKDMKNAEFYSQNLDKFLNELDKLDLEYQHAVNTAANKTLIFGDRFPFRYLFRDYGLDYYAAFPGCSTDTDVSAKTMAFLIDKTNENNIDTVYYIEFSTRKIADTISEETGAEALLFHSCHTVSKEDIEKGVTYLELMRNNLVNLKRGLGVGADQM